MDMPFYGSYGSMEHRLLSLIANLFVAISDMIILTLFKKYNGRQTNLFKHIESIAKSSHTLFLEHITYLILIIMANIKTYLDSEHYIPNFNYHR